MIATLQGYLEILFSLLEDKIAPMGTAGTLDRFRNLPHKIAYQILLFISMGELARFRLVSKDVKGCVSLSLTWLLIIGLTDRLIQIVKSNITCFLTDGWICVRMMASRFQHCISIGPSREAILTKNSTLANCYLRLRVLKLNFLRQKLLPGLILLLNYQFRSWNANPWRFLCLSWRTKALWDFPRYRLLISTILKQLKLENVHPEYEFIRDLGSSFCKWLKVLQLFKLNWAKTSYHLPTSPAQYRCWTH